MDEKKPVRVAVIDDGVNEKLYGIGDLEFNIEINSKLANYKRAGYDAFLPGHGTTCAAIISKYAPDARIGCIKVLNETSRRAEKHQLMEAIAWCVDNGIKLVNMSLGTIDFRDFEEIRHCVNKAADSGLIIVAACNNKNVYTVPACLSSVIGVRSRKLYTDAQYRMVPYSFDGIDAESSGRHLLTDVSGNSRYTSPANSFAAPLVTALTHNILKKNPDACLAEIKKQLYMAASNSENEDYDPYLCMTMDWSRKGEEYDGRRGCFYDSCRQTGQEVGKVWRRELYKKHLMDKLAVKLPEIKIPVIAICDEQDEKLLEKLDTFFKKDGYYSVKTSTDYMDVPKGSEYLPEGVNIKQFLSLIYKKYDCDVILFKYDAKQTYGIEGNYSFDIILYKNNERDLYECKSVDDCGRSRIFIAKDNMDMTVEQIYKNMMVMFEGAG